jgi:hypothetical protein
MTDIERYRPVNGLYADTEGAVVKYEDHLKIVKAYELVLDTMTDKIIDKMRKILELEDIIAGLQDVIAGRVKPLSQIEKELAKE